MTVLKPGAVSGGFAANPLTGSRLFLDHRDGGGEPTRRINPDDVTLQTLERVREEVNKIGSSLDEYRKRVDSAPTRADLKEELDRVRDDLVPKMVQRSEFEAVLKAQDDIRARLDEVSFNAGTSRGADEVADEEHKSVFRQFLLHGLDPNCSAVSKFRETDHYKNIVTRSLPPEMSPEERAAAISTSVGVEGGFLVPLPITQQMLKIATVIDPIESLAQKIPLSKGNSYQVPKRTTTVSGSFGDTAQGGAQKTTEKGTPTAYSPAFTLKTRVVHPLSVLTDGVSIDFISDVVGAESIIAEWAAESIGYQRGYRFIHGTNDGEPEGFAVSSEVSTVTGTDTTTSKIAGNDFFKLLTNIKSVYRGQAVFLFNSTVLYNALVLKDDNGNYIFPFSVRDGIPSTLAGKRFEISESLADDGTTGNKAVAFADWKKFYWVAERGGITLIKDPLSDKPNLEYLWRLRDDGAIANAEAGTILVMG